MSTQTLILHGGQAILSITSSNPMRRDPLDLKPRSVIGCMDWAPGKGHAEPGKLP